MSFRIEHNGDEWPGSFQVAVTAATSDILSDGPIEATVTLEDQEQREVVIHGLDVKYLYLGEGNPIDRDHLLAIDF